MNDQFFHCSSRRTFLQTLGAAAVSVALSGRAAARLRSLAKPVRIGLIADLHQDIMHDGEARLDAFLKEMSETRPDALMQLGDFAYPGRKKKVPYLHVNSASRRVPEP